MAREEDKEDKDKDKDKEQEEEEGEGDSEKEEEEGDAEKVEDGGEFLTGVPSFHISVFLYGQKDQKETLPAILLLLGKQCGTIYIPAPF